MESIGLRELYEHLSQERVKRYPRNDSYLTGSEYGYKIFYRIYMLYMKKVVERVLNNEMWYFPKNFGAMFVRRLQVKNDTKKVWKKKYVMKEHRHKMNKFMMNPKTPGEYFRILVYVTYPSVRKLGIKYFTDKKVRKMLSEGLFKGDLAYKLQGYEPEQVGSVG